MKPTAAVIDSGIPRSHSDTTPPLSANGMPVNTSRPSFTLLNITNSSTNTMNSASARPASGARSRCSCSNCPPTTVAGRHAHVLLQLLARVGDERPDVAPAHVRADDHAPLAVLAADLVQAGATSIVASSASGTYGAAASGALAPAAGAGSAIGSRLIASMSERSSSAAARRCRSGGRPGTACRPSARRRPRPPSPAGRPRSRHSARACRDRG